MRGVTDFRADSFFCDPVSCLVFLPFSSPDLNYLLLLLALQKFFSPEICITLTKNINEHEACVTPESFLLNVSEFCV